MSAIFEIIKERCNYKEGKVEDLSVITNRVILRGYKEEELNLTLKSYEYVNVIMRKDRNGVRLLI
jgi:hypothetical protein